MFCCPLSHKPKHSMQYCLSQRAQLIKSPTAFSHATQTSSDFLFSPLFFFFPTASVAWIPDDPGTGSSTAAVPICPGFGRFVFHPRLFFSCSMPRFSRVRSTGYKLVVRNLETRLFFTTYAYPIHRRLSNIGKLTFWNDPALRTFCIPFKISRHDLFIGAKTVSSICRKHDKINFMFQRKLGNSWIKMTSEIITKQDFWSILLHCMREEAFWKSDLKHIRIGPTRFCWMEGNHRLHYHTTLQISLSCSCLSRFRLVSVLNAQAPTRGQDHLEG